jgi:hypothetical protein
LISRVLGYGSTDQKPHANTTVALMCLTAIHLPSLFSLSSDIPEVLFIMREAVDEGCSPNSSPQPHIIVLQRYFFYIMHPSGTYVAYGIRLYSVLIKILALIFELKSKYLIHFEQPDAMVINCNC